MKKLLFVAFIGFACVHEFHAQLIANPKSITITVQKAAGADLIVPLDINFINPTNASVTDVITLNINNTAPNLVQQIRAGDMVDVSVLNNGQGITLAGGASASAPLALGIYIRGTVAVPYEKFFTVDVTEGARILCTIKIIVQPLDGTLSLSQYFLNANILSYVNKVESASNILTINGYKIITENGQTDTVFMKKNVALKNGQVFTIYEGSWLFGKSHWYPLPVSLITVPFKVRPAMTKDNVSYNSNANSGLTNIGLNIDLLRRQMDRYFSSGKKISHKLAVGFFGSPTVDEFDNTLTNGFLPTGTKNKQLLVSAGISLSYSYNDLSFIFVPAGWDFGTTAVSKSWIYNGIRWWGFGIAISPRAFSAILNKP
jgi:hypothetical protein